MIQITPGWLARHTPQGPGGRQAALIDIAQDLLLTRLHQRGVFDYLVFKGGTALRKLYAGNAGRFSTDLDFSVRTPADSPETVAELLRSEIDGRDIDGFRYFVEDHRGRAQVRYETPLGGVGNLTTKLDTGSAPWLPPTERGWVRLPIHAAYRLPGAIPVMALAENMAEKVARLTRRTPARDVYDLAWIASTSPHSGFDRATSLAVLGVPVSGITGAVPWSHRPFQRKILIFLGLVGPDGGGGRKSLAAGRPVRGVGRVCLGDAFIGRLDGGTEDLLR